MRNLILLISAFLVMLVIGCNSDDISPEPPSPPPQEPDTSWSIASSIPEPLQEFHAAVLDEMIYIAGGIDGNNEDSNRAYRFDPESDTWERIADLPSARHHMPLVVANDSLYAIGGLITVSDGFSAANNLWLYDVENDEWLSRASLPQSRGACAVGVVDDKIIVVGGFGQAQMLLRPTVIYDPETDAWTTGADIPTRRDHLVAAAVDGIVYAIGGRFISLSPVTDTVEAYNPETDEWTTVSSMQTGRAGLGGTVYDGKIYTYGGETHAVTNNNHEVYDPAADTWETLSPMPEPRHGMGVAEVNGKIYVIGGGPTVGFSQSATVQVFEP